MSSAYSNRKRAKLVVLQTHPIQYYAPVYRALAERGNIEVTVIYLSDAGVRPHRDPGFGLEVAWDVPLLDGYDFRILQVGKSIGHSNFLTRRDSRIGRFLCEQRPDWLLVYGYASLLNWQALAWAKRHGVRVLYHSDSNIRIMRRGLRFLAKRKVVRWFFKNVNVFLSPSDANFEYLRCFDVPAERIAWCPFAIDVHRFQLEIEKEKSEMVDFVWSGKMIGFKRPLDFVYALIELVKRGHGYVRSVMLGSGPLLDEVREVAGDLVRHGNLELRGFVNQSAMPRELHRGRVFVFTSERDPYGLVATEAAACGMAVISADINGCVGNHASAQPGRNALTYRSGEIEALADCMELLIKEPMLLESLRKESLVIAADHDVRRATSIIEAVVSGTQYGYG